MNYDSIVNFLFEINNLKRFEHCGTKFVGVKHPDSIAEHVFRAAQIGYILAELEGVDRGRVLEIVLFHDNGEVRVGDFHRIADHYLDSDEAENAAFEDQISQLPDGIQKKLTGLVAKYNANEKDPEFTVAKDADLLETIFQAKEYLELGYPTQRWIDNGRKYLKTESAKKIFDAMGEKSITDWWDKLNVAD